MDDGEDKMDKTFENFWISLRKSLKEPRHIGNWTVNSGYLGKDFFVRAKQEGIYCDPPGVLVEKDAFFEIWERWDRYLSSEISRKELRDLPNYFTKYIISIFHHFMEV